MSKVIVRYKVKQEKAQENIDYIVRMFCSKEDGAIKIRQN